MIIYYSDYTTSDHRPQDCLDLAEPDPLFKHLTRRTVEEKGERGPSHWPTLMRCPAFKNHLDNMFCVRSPFDFSVTRNDWDIPSEHRTIDMLDRSDDKRMMTIGTPRPMFVSEKPCLMTQLPAYLEREGLSSRGVIVPGEFDIGRHWRPLETAIDLHKSEDLEIRMDEVLYYLKFHTEEEIVFKKFYCSNDISRVVESRETRMSLGGFLSTPLNVWYDINHRAKKHKLMLKLIKENLIE